LLAQGVDPGEKRKAEAVAGADSFEAVAREWIAKRSPKWAPTHTDKIVRRLGRDVFPWIGSKQIAKITAPEVLAVLRRIESRGAIETAYRARTNCGQEFRYAVATGRADGDVSRDLHGALTAATPKHYAAIVDPVHVGELLQAIDGFAGGSFVTKSAL
jgi:integrase